MRLSIALGALAGGLTLGWAAFAEAADQAPPPAAPIFYCPSAPPAHGAVAAAQAAPQTCSVAHHVVERRHVERRHEVERRRVIARRAAPNEDVSASQAFIYRYEEARRGLDAEAADEAWRNAPADRRVHERVYAEGGPPPGPTPPPCPGAAMDRCQPGPAREPMRAHVFVEPPPPASPPIAVVAQPQAPPPVYVQVAPTPPTRVYVRMAPAAPPQVYVERERAPPAPPAYYYRERPPCPNVAPDRCPLANEQGPWNEPAYAQAPPPRRELPPPPAYVERPPYADRGVAVEGGAYAYERRESEQSSGWRYSDNGGQVRSEQWREGGYEGGGRPAPCASGCSGSPYQQGEWRDGSYGAVTQVSGRDAYGYLVWPGKSPEQ